MLIDLLHNGQGIHNGVWMTRDGLHIPKLAQSPLRQIPDLDRPTPDLAGVQGNIIKQAHMSVILVIASCDVVQEYLIHQQPHRRFIRLPLCQLIFTSSGKFLLVSVDLRLANFLKMVVDPSL
jgi:hypothetical protein